MQINVSYSKGGGKPTEMRIDARPLHDYLRALGVPLTEEGPNQTFADPPYSDYVAIDARNFAVTPGTLLRTANGGVIVIKLSEHFRQPLTRAQMDQLADSVATVGRRVIEHYQPIEVSLVVNFRSKQGG